MKGTANGSPANKLVRIFGFEFWAAGLSFNECRQGG
jgi:hypothetical protein